MSELEFDPRGFVRVVFSGPLKGPEALEAIRVLVRDPRFRTGMNGLVDLRRVGAVEMFVDDVRAGASLSARLGDAFSGSRWAIVAGSDTTFGIARQYELMLADPRFEVRSFRDVEEAERFIGARDPEA